MISRAVRRAAVLAAGLALLSVGVTARAAGYKVQRFEPTWGHSDFFEIDPNQDRPRQQPPRRVRDPAAGLITGRSPRPAPI